MSSWIKRLSRRLPAVFSLLPLVSACSEAPPALGGEEGPHRIQVQRDVKVEMPDGIALAGDLYLPAGLEEPLPSVLIRLPYNRAWYTPATDPARFLASWGYAVLVQDVRGRWESEGSYRLLADDRIDGMATLDWMTAQPWSNGRVGTFGCSNLGENQLVLATGTHAAHRAMIPQGAGGAVGTMGGWNSAFGALEGGAVGMSGMTGWFLDWGGRGRPAVEHDADREELVRSLPLSAMMEAAGVDDEEWRHYVTEPPASAWWGERGYLTDDARFITPGLHVNTWFDPTVSQTLSLVDMIGERALPGSPATEQFAVIGPWGHCELDPTRDQGSLGDLEVEGAAFPYLRLYRTWFDRWLRGDDGPDFERPRFTFFTFGENQWRTSEQWPPSWTEQEAWFLALEQPDAPAGSLSSDALSADHQTSWLYDPADPVPSRGGPVCCTGLAGDDPGAFHQGYLDERTDIVRFTSPVLAEDRLVAGPVELVLYVASSAPDTDFTAKLVHLTPDGRALAIRDGVQRTRYRNGGVEPEFLEPESVYEIRVRLGDIAYHIPAGHRLRVDLSSSSFPRWDRNLNTTAPRGEGVEWAVATNTVFAGERYPSRLLIHASSNPPRVDGGGGER